MVTEKNKTKTILLWILIGVLLVAIAVVFVRFARKPKPEIPAVTPRPTPEVIIKEREVERIVETEKVITAGTIQDGLRDMGKLVTEEYYFTEVISFSSIKKYLKVEWKITESSFLASYDGVIHAGIDFAEIGIEKDDELKKITVRLPQAEIQAVDVDPESLVVYSEKEGIGNRITLEDYNNALIELEKNAKNKALEKGILERADESTERIIRSFIGSLVDTSAYTVAFQRNG